MLFKLIERGGSIPVRVYPFGRRLLSHSRVIVRAFDAERRENACSSGLPVPLYDVEDGSLADSEITGDPAVTSSLADGLKDPGRKLA